MQLNRHVEAALALAQALNDEDYDAALVLLAPECRYEIDGKTERGRTAIIESYRLIGDWVKTTFDSYSYSSRSQAQPDRDRPASH